MRKYIFTFCKIAGQLIGIVLALKFICFVIMALFGKVVFTLLAGLALIAILVSLTRDVVRGK